MRVLVTGVTSQIGEEILKRLAPGNDLVATVSSRKSLENNLSKGNLGANSLELIECDFTNFNYENDPILKECEKGFDILILNACTKIPEYKLLHEHDIDTLYSFVEENVKPNLRILQKCLPYMLESQFGRIVFISTMAVEMGLSNYSPYIVAKGALEGLMRNIAVDYGKNNIYANVLRPGIIKTERTGALLDNPKYQIKVNRIIPAGKVGVPAQIAEVVSTLVSPTSYINGQTINVSGGLPLVGAMARL